jgi:hypothetical protein
MYTRLQASRALALSLLLSALPLTSTAQTASSAAPPIAVWRDAHGLSAVDGALWAGGPDWRARIDAAGIEFTPAFGQRAPRTYPLRLALQSVARERGAELALAAGEPQWIDGKAVFQRTATVQEVYEARREGLEQSLVFAEPLVGGGDLVVRYAYASELDPALDGAGLALEAQGLGAITIGAVTGIDASGAQVAGSMQLAGDVLELRLPAAFVDGARYPLVLDPLIGTDFELDSDPTDLYDDVSPAIAHNSDADSYLVVWTRAFAITDMDIRGQRVSEAGTLSGSLLFIETGATSAMATSPAVGNCRFAGAYLVAWESAAGLFSDRDLVCRSVNAITGALSANTVTLAATTANEDNPAIGGEASLIDDEVLVVYSVAGSGIRGRQVNVSASGNPFAVGLQIDISDATTTSWEDMNPAISKGGGYGNTWLVAWERYFSTAATPYYDVRYLLVDRNLTLLTPITALTASTATSETHIGVDGDGAKFAVVYEQELAAGGDTNVYAHHVVNGALFGAGLVDSAAIPVATSVFNESDPDVVYTGLSFVCAWIGTSILSSNSPIVMQSLDVVDLSPCGSAVSFSSATLDYDFPVLSSSAGSTLNVFGNVLCVVQGRDTSSSPGVILAQLYQPMVGVNTELGGGCGGGRAELGCILSTRTSLTSHVVEASPGMPAWLILSPDLISLTVNGCSLWADPFHGFIFSGGTTDSFGEAHHTLTYTASPGLVGLSFYEQWALQKAGAPWTFGSGGPTFTLSNTIIATFE